MPRRYQLPRSGVSSTIVTPLLTKKSPRLSDKTWTILRIRFNSAAKVKTRERIHSPTAFCAAASKCILHVKLDLGVGMGSRRAAKSKIMRNPRRGRTVGRLSQFPDFNIDDCGEKEKGRDRETERENARVRSRALALSNVQTFALYFNFATLNMP